ncbi:NAD(P)/FAD-dependent oxidoreductase [Aquipuribacter nitratireducens]|uniref:NAD(P)/FAD-dependent oxidoreductase n=1 Tax=Aquipuribacter nitratireducens TaxID=650104 RepID=A0ABW0GLK2_9MICO
MSAQRHVIVGAGLAGAGAAAAIREADPDASITVLGEEAHEPYERPGLSKDYLQGESDADSLLVHDRGWYDEHDVTLRTGAHVDSIDRSAGEVVLADGERLGYDRLLLATGSAPRRLPVDGIDLDGVLTFRTREDSDAVKAAIASGDPLVVVGAGWIGLEVASAARAAGVDVTVVHDGSVPLGHVVGDVVGQRFAELARSAGVRLVDGTQVARVHGDGRVQEVELSDGQRVPASTVVLGVGITPRTELAEAAGLRVDDGVLVDGSFRTEDDAVFAVGDVARAHNAWVGEPVRLEHYAAASDGGPIAGRSMAGALREGEQWAKPPFFWSDQFGAGLEYRGWADPERHHVVLRASAPASETGTPWFAFWHDGGRLVAGLHVDGWDDADTVKDLVTSRAEVDVARLADPQVPLGDVRV